MINRSDDEATLILAKLRTLISWSQIVSELSDTSGGVASFMDESNEEPMVVTPTDRPESEGQSSYGTWYNSLSNTAWLPIVFDRNIWQRAGLTGKVAPEAYQDHISVATSGLDGVSRQSPGSASGDTNTKSPTVSSSHEGHINIPIWALRSSTVPSLVEEPFEAIFQSLRAEIDDGAMAETLCGSHAHVAALYDEKAFRSAPKLSRIAASIVKSIKMEPFPLSLTVVGMMWLYWSLFRWALMPSRRTYEELPETLRPRPSQVYTRHPFVLDFVNSPELRDHLCGTGDFDLSWITAAFETMVCESPISLAEAIGPDSATGELDLTEETKEQVGKAEAWSIDASVKAKFPDIGRFVKLRGDESA